MATVMTLEFTIATDMVRRLKAKVGLVPARKEKSNRETAQRHRQDIVKSEKK
jgi:hypothetical protein